VQKIGKYEILSKLGAGGMGVVYKALDPLMERVVALKTMSEDLDAEPDLRERFFREARSAGQLSHKNIVTIYDLGVEGNLAYIAMEFLDGVDLKTKLDRRERLPLEEALRIVSDVCEGLSHAHRKGVVHRDVKPGNIHITQQGQVKIMDFGLARIASSNITKTGIALGTPNYMSPEQAKGDKVDQRADIFSIGAVAYELFAGKKPFDPRSTYDWRQVFFKVIFEEPEPIETFNPALPPELTAVIRRAMAKDPAARYQQVDEMIRDLDRLRRVLDERKRKLLDEARAAIARLDELVSANRALLRDALETSETAEETAIAPPRAGQGYLELWEMAEQARREYERFARLVTERKEGRKETDEKLKSRLAEATAFEKSGDFEKALEVGEKILGETPGHPEATSLVARNREEIARRAREEAKKRVLDGLMQKSQELYLRGELGDCLASLERALTMEPSLSEARTLRQKTLSRIEKQKADRQIEGLVREADSRFSRQDLVGCLALLDEALKLRADHAEAAGLRERAAQRLKELAEIEEKRRQARTALTEARAALAAFDLERARERAEQARSLQPELTGAAELLAEIERAAERRAGEERKRRLDDLLEQARAADQAGEEEAAVERLGEALALAPGHSPALELLEAVERRRAERERVERERQEKVEATLTAARKAKEAGQLEEVIEAARAALEIEPHHGEAQRVLDEARREKKEREQKIAKLLKEARALDKAGDEEGALARLEELLALSSEHRAALELRERIDERRAARERAEQERRDKLAALLSGARESRRAGSLEKARDEARAALDLDAGHLEAKRFLEEVQDELKKREERIAALLEKAEAAERAEDEARALSALEELLSLSPQHRRGLELKESLLERQKRREQERRERIAANLEQARQAEHKGDFERTVSLAGAVLKEAGEHAEARELLKRAEEARERARVQAASKQLLTEADRLSKAGDPRGAAKLLERAEPAVGSLPEVRQARDRCLKAAEALETAKKAQEQLEEGKRAFERGNFAACEQAMERVLALTRDSAEALRYLSQARERLAAEREKEERAQRLAEALRLAEEAARQGQLDAASRHIDAALALDAANTRALRLRAQIERQLAEQRERAERERRAQALLAQAAATLKAGDAPHALALLEQAESLAQGLAGAAKLRKQVDRALSRSSAAPSSGNRLLVAGLVGVGVLGLLLFGVWSLVGKKEDGGTAQSSSTAGTGEVTSSVPLDTVDRSPSTTTLPTVDAGRGSEEAASARAERELNQARARVGTEREAAMRAGGASFPAFQQAEELGKQADGHQRNRDYPTALGKLNQAIELYGRAQSEAVQQALRQADAAAQRTLAEGAQREFERVRGEATAAATERWAPGSFRQAMTLAETAQAKLGQRDYAGAAGDFQSANQAMQRAQSEAQQALRQAQSRLDAARRDLEGAKQAGAEPPQAVEEERRGRALLQEGRLVEAAEAFERATVLVRAAAQAMQAGAAEKRAVREALAGYEAAMEGKDLAGLKSLWPTLGGGEGQLDQMFKMAKSVEVELDCSDPEVTGDRATVTCRRVIQITLPNLDRPRPGESTNAFTLRKQRGSWIIQEIK
jgi:serine/threonine-protein kinase